MSTTTQASAFYIVAGEKVTVRWDEEHRSHGGHVQRIMIDKLCVSEVYPMEEEGLARVTAHRDYNVARRVLMALRREK